MVRFETFPDLENYIKSLMGDKDSYESAKVLTDFLIRKEYFIEYSYGIYSTPSWKRMAMEIWIMYVDSIKDQKQ